MQTILFKEGQEYKKEDVRRILKENKRTYVDMWPNFWGWDTYYTTEPTFATPLGGRVRIFAEF